MSQILSYFTDNLPTSALNVGVLVFFLVSHELLLLLQIHFYSIFELLVISLVLLNVFLDQPAFILLSCNLVHKVLDLIDISVDASLIIVSRAHHKERVHVAFVDA